MTANAPLRKSKMRMAHRALDPGQNRALPAETPRPDAGEPADYSRRPAPDNSPGPALQSLLFMV